MGEIEIRPITRAEAVDYLRVLPFANGLPNWEPAPAVWHGGPEAWPRPRRPADERQLLSWVDEVMADNYHPQAAFVDGELVGGSAMLSLAITAPGLRPVPLGGVTATGVLPTHRRRGLLRGMMQAMFDEAHARGEPLGALSASEGGIYGRFGFSPATMRVRWELDAAKPRSSIRSHPRDRCGSWTPRRHGWPGRRFTHRSVSVGSANSPRSRTSGQV
ncbi:hypothetical protein GCM10027614_08460 [Micromonospora vulcania]